MTPALRSFLFVPGTRPDRFDKALAAGADAVIFDLEDAVDPSRKAEARAVVSRFLSGSGAAPCLRLVRINARHTPWFDADRAALSTLEADGVVVPKAGVPDDVAVVAAAAGNRLVVPLLETARAILDALAIASVRASIPALLFGAEDLTAEMGIARTIDGDELTTPRALVAMAATAVGAVAVDAVFTDMADATGLRRDAERARSLGFRGKMAIHPAQLPVIHDVFAPTEVEVADARRVLESFEAAQARGEGVVRLGDEMIDAPVVARARQVLARIQPRR